jgi:proteasome lid subunit RPN8/RPN11
MKNLDLLLEQEPITAAKSQARDSYADKRWGASIGELQITKAAYEKAFAYARIISELSGDLGTEITGYLVTPKEAKDRVVRDCYLINGQLAEPAEVKIQPQDIIQAGREIDEMGYRVLGWWHSHGDLKTFHSSIDVENQMTVLNAIAPFNYVIEKADKKLEDLKVYREGKDIVLSERRDPGIKYRLTLDENSGLTLANMQIEMEKRVGFAYSLVVHGPKLKVRVPIVRKKNTKNSLIGFFHSSESDYEPVMVDGRPAFRIEHRDREIKPYAEIATRLNCDFCNEMTEKSRDVDVRVFDKDNIDFDEEELFKEVREKVRFESSPSKLISRRDLR